MSTSQLCNNKLEASLLPSKHVYISSAGHSTHSCVSKCAFLQVPPAMRSVLGLESVTTCNAMLCQCREGVSACDSACSSDPVVTDSLALELLVQSHQGKFCPKTDASIACHVCVLHQLPVQARRLVGPLIIGQVRLSVPDQTMTHDSTPELNDSIQDLPEEWKRTRSHVLWRICY